MPEERKEVRVLMVGEPAVGKTTLILSLVAEEYPQSVPSRTDDIIIPAVTPLHNVLTRIVDYSASEQSREELVVEIQRSNVICVVYSMTDESTFEQIFAVWLPLIRESLGAGSSTPIIIVGNKSDCVTRSNINNLISFMNEFSEIETCIECSAKTLKNVTELFFYAQKAVLHPSSPLYDVSKHYLTQNCINALTKIFKVSDMDNDNVLSDTELNEFQERCFGESLNSQGLSDIKSIIEKNLDDGFTCDGLTLQGFLFLHYLFVQRGRHETTWTVLRKFGYLDNLQFSNEITSPILKIPDGYFSELSQKGFKFVQFLFDKHDTDKDGLLSKEDLDDLFSICLDHRWCDELEDRVCLQFDGTLSLDLYMCQWALRAYLEPHRTLALFSQLGYGYLMADDVTTSLTLYTCRQRAEKQPAVVRSTYVCNVIGAKSTGKSTFCRCMLRSCDRGCEHSPVTSSESDNRGGEALRQADESVSACCASHSVYGARKYLILREVPETALRALPADSEQGAQSVVAALTDCDVICLVYDVCDSSTFRTVANVYQKHIQRQTSLPCLLLGNKSDLFTSGRFVHSSSSTVTDFCQRMRLPPPVIYSSLTHLSSLTTDPQSNVFVKLATMASYPSYRNHINLISSATPRWIHFGVFIMLVVCGSLAVVRVSRHIGR